MIGWTDGVDVAEQVAMRQLRHHTKNALQRLLCQVASCPGLQESSAGRALAMDLERRIHLSAGLSDALFGLTGPAGSLEERLSALCGAVVGLMADGTQMIATRVAVRGRVGAQEAEVVVRVAHELVGNAVKHGMTLRVVGQIEVEVVGFGNGVVLTVADDGWGLCRGAVPGEGMGIARMLVEQEGGTLQLARVGERTVATVSLPARIGAGRGQ